eukprot:TRINITY_DN26286_c0_g1_i1.p1 TRINITY_DN26286_c0_g1~~TRINITY_DN26286_c0_g1_i1.p1  ORF type:complete len:117 (+),score=47.30 TRINITY_DN26286_c0_g1_i1:176-526(+)
MCIRDRDMTMMFEVEDLAVASPATVSRCGMIYMDPLACTPTDARIASWLEVLPKHYTSQTEVLEFADNYLCLLYTSDAADDLLCVDLGGRRIIKKKKKELYRIIKHNELEIRVAEK